VIPRSLMIPGIVGRSRFLLAALVGMRRELDWCDLPTLREKHAEGWGTRPLTSLRMTSQIRKGKVDSSLREEWEGSWIGVTMPTLRKKHAEGWSTPQRRMGRPMGIGHPGESST
jgi:hypothetical protein